MPRPGRCTLRRETWYPLYRRLGGPHGRSGRMRKISLLPGSIPEPSSPHTVPCGRIFVDVEMQKSNHNRSTGDQINAVCLVNNTNYCSCSHWKHAGNHWSCYVLRYDQVYEYSVRLRNVRLKKNWEVVKDLSLVVSKTFLLSFLKRFVCGVYDDTCYTHHKKHDGKSVGRCFSTQHEHR